MGKIIVLDELTASKIAAGEVVERPVSVVKELVENSIDAGATNILVQIRNGGISQIKIVDNGGGIEEDDASVAFERHATSKIRDAEDLSKVSTLGFRGEALASIAAVSRVELITKTQTSQYGTHVMVENGKIKNIKHVGCPVGTTFIVKDLFYTMPARFKFLKKDSTEAGYITDLVGKMSLGNPDIAFKLVGKNDTVLHTPGNGDLLSTIFALYGKTVVNNVIEISYDDQRVNITGFTGNPEIARANRSYQLTYVNGRYIKSSLISSAIDQAYKTWIMKNKHPFVILKIEVNPFIVDINVHPTKMEVKFSEEQIIFRAVYNAINNALLSSDVGRKVKIPVENKTVNVNFTDNISNSNDTDIKDANNHNTSNFVNNSTIQQSFVKMREDNHEQYKISRLVQPLPIADCERSNEADKCNCSIEKERHDQEGQSNSELANSREQLLSDARIIGQFLSTYILVQSDHDLLLIDQHAAHERIIYEALKQKYNNGSELAQMLLSPIVVELMPKEINIVKDKKELFHKSGFMFDEFGSNSIILRSFPYINGVTAVKDIFLEVVDDIINKDIIGKNSDEVNIVTDEVLYSIACKAAIKANTVLSHDEIVEILKQLDNIQYRHTCPHGRPVTVKISKQQIEKMFKRIV